MIPFRLTPIDNHIRQNRKKTLAHAAGECR